MDDIEERKRIQAGLETILLIANTGPFLRSAIFHTTGASKKRRELDVLNKLCDAKVLSRKTVSNAVGNLGLEYYSVENFKALEDICKDEKRVASLIWGGSLKPPVQHPLWSPPSTPAAIPSKTAAVAPVKEAPKPAPPPPTNNSNDEVMYDVVKLLRAVCESMIYTREKVDMLEQKVDELLKVWK